MCHCSVSVSGWAVVALLALGSLSLFFFTLEPVVRSKAAIRLATLTIVGDSSRSRIASRCYTALAPPAL